LPYEFDTATRWRRVQTLAFGSVAGIAVLAVLAALMGKQAAALQLTLCLGVAAVIARKLRGWRAFGAIGTLSRTEVVTRPVNVYGIPMRVPVGVFPLAAFQGLRIERRLAKYRGQLRDLASVFLVGRGEVPEVQIFEGAAADGLQLATSLASELSLSLVETVPSGTRRVDRSL
jgi:hypothetical protein